MVHSSDHPSMHVLQDNSCYSCYRANSVKRRFEQIESFLNDESVCTTAS